MKTLNTALVSAFLVSLAVAGLSACPSFAEDNGIDFWNMGVYQRQLDLCKQERGRLQIENEETFRRLTLKEEILTELLEGRINDQEATERFLLINRTLSTPTAYLLLYPGMTELERATRQLIAFLRADRGDQARFRADQIECNLYTTCE